MIKNFTDRAVLAGTKIRESDGALLADVRIARTGIQKYLGRELGFDKDVINVYRPGSEVFSEGTLASAAHKTVTNDHPPEMVSADNWKKYSVGQTGDEVTGEGIYIRIPLMVSDGQAIKDIEAGKRELSAGYTCELDCTPGVTKDGQKYDATQKNIRINHVAIVDAGRAGPEVRIGDGAVSWGSHPIHQADKREVPEMDIQLRTAVVDGLSVSTTEQGAQAIAKLMQDREDLKKGVVQLQTDHATAIAGKDADLAKKDKEIEDLKGSVLTSEQVDALVVYRSNLLDKARKVYADIKIEGKTNDQVRKEVVIHKLGDEAVAGKAQAYIDARFDMLVEASDEDDPVRESLRDGNRTVVLTGQKASDAAYAAMVKRKENAWKGETKGNA